MAASPFPSCGFEDDLCDARPAIRKYIADTWSFPYTFLQPKLDASGNPVLDADGNPVPDPTNPVVLTGSAMSAELRRGNTLLATLAASTDSDTDLPLGKFKIVVPSGTTAALTPDPPRAAYPTRLIVIQTDSLGNVTTLAVQHIAVAIR